ncbi:Cytokinesis protein sepH [Diplonema papillatum]|nr:Cytokinesis protein sepH [Diplonema papillatum]
MERNFLDIKMLNDIQAAKVQQLDSEKQRRRRLMHGLRPNMTEKDDVTEHPVEEKPATVSELGSASETSASGSLRKKKKPPTLCGVSFSKVLGEGAFGTVFLAFRKDTGNFVAVKRIRLGRLSKSDVSRVVREIRIMKELKGHGNVVKYLNAEKKESEPARGNGDGSPREDNAPELFIFMEYAPGGSLNDIAKSIQTVVLSEETVKCYVYQILHGLSYLHAKRIVHRDVKGANILLGSDGAVKLADFGTAVALDASKPLTEYAGTPWFMAPEVVRCPEDRHGHDTKADVWSLGATVIELLNGSPPLKKVHSQPEPMMFALCNGTADPYSDLPSDVSPACQDFVRKCLQRDSYLRPAVDELLLHEWLEDVQDIVDGEED